MISGKKILLGITGSIAAYKAIYLVRRLVTAGAEVRIIITPSAKDFVSPLVLSTVSKNNVLINIADENTWANHVMLGRWADVMVIAPLSCNTLAKMANGICDNLLLATYLSATCPVVVAPAMDEDMWLHPSTKRNIRMIREYGNAVISVVKGELASGLYGEGRMVEPEDIVTFLEENCFRSHELSGKKALVTAGPTHEALDPVRFISNHSSGKMGIAIAEALYLKGAEVRLVTGPVNAKTRFKGIDVIKVTSAADMHKTCIASFASMDVAVMSAAVADYTPAFVSAEKIKKNDDRFIIELKKTQDILKSLGDVKKQHQLLVGFALETSNERENALKKLESKNADMIILNSLNDRGAGFGLDTNKVTIFEKNGEEYTFETKTKKAVAEDIVDIITKKLNDKA